MFSDGFGGICGVAEKSFTREELDTRMKGKGKSGMVEEYGWVLQSRDFGMVPHTAFGMGFGARLEMVLWRAARKGYDSFSSNLWPQSHSVVEPVAREYRQSLLQKDCFRRRCNRTYNVNAFQMPFAVIYCPRLCLDLAGRRVGFGSGIAISGVLNPDASQGSLQASIT